MTAASIQERIDYLSSYFQEDYMEDNIEILNERFKKTLVFGAELPALLKTASTLRDQRLSELVGGGHKMSEAKLLAYTEVNLVEELKSLRSTINQAHRTLQSQISVWKEDYNRHRFAGNNTQ